MGREEGLWVEPFTKSVITKKALIVSQILKGSGVIFCSGKSASTFNPVEK